MSRFGTHRPWVRAAGRSVSGHLDANLVAELPAFAVYATGALGGVPLVAVLVAVVVAVVALSLPVDCAVRNWAARSAVARLRHQPPRPQHPRRLWRSGQPGRRRA
jgi:hypothetical protein